MKSSRALVRLERKLARDRTAILSGSDVQLLNRELRRALADSFPGLPASALDRSEDVIRWRALGEQFRSRNPRDSRDVGHDQHSAVSVARDRERAPLRDSA
jgi:hypothetical protein